MSIHNSSVVEQAVAQMVELDRFYNLNLWPGTRAADCTHDLGVMLAMGDLESISTELLGHDGSVLLVHQIAFGAAASAAREKVVPVIDRRQVAGGRFLVNRRSVSPSFAHLLRLRWETAQALPRAASDRVASSRGHGEFHVGQSHRRRLVVRQAGARGFAFAEDAELGATVYLHAGDAPAGWAFQPGQRLTAVVVSTQRGLQGRAIRPA
jgi:hypothetical protein